MTKDLCDLICKALEARDADYARRDAYAGRGAYGEITYGVVVDDLPSTVNAVADHVDDRAGGAKLVAAVAALRTDNMGRDSIIIY